jgi:hypothetical protein
MQKIVRFSIAALAAALAACSHGGNTSLPASQNVQTNDSAIRQKVAKEAQREASSFVAQKHQGYMADTSTVQTWPSGISEGGQLPVPGGMFDIVNQYNTTENGQYVTVYAGSLKATGEGVLLVVKRSANLHNVIAQTFTVAPAAVRIQSATGGQLQLQTVRGAVTQSIPFRVPL